MNWKPWRIVACLWVAFCLAYVARQSIFSIFPVLRSQLGFTEVQLGLTGTVFLWTYALANIAAGYAADHFSQSKVITLSLVSWSCCTIMLGTTSSPGALLSWRALLALTQAFYIVSAISLISQWHCKRTRSTALSLHGTSQMAGVVIGGWYGGYVTETLDWRWMLWLLGGIGLLYGLWLQFLISDGHAADEEMSADLGPAARVSLVSVIINPTYLAFCLTFFALCAMIWINYTWLADLLKSKFNLPLSAAGWIAAAYTQLPTLAGLLVGAPLGDRCGPSSGKARLWLVLLGIGLSSPCFYWLATSQSLAGIKLAGIGYGFFQGIFSANFMASLVSFLPAYHRGVGVGVCNMIGAISGGLAAYLVGQLHDDVAIEVLFSAVASLGLAASLVLAATLLFSFRRNYQVCQQSKGI